MAALTAADEKTIDKLKNLLFINITGIDGYRQSAKNATNPEFRSLFTDYIIQREDFAGELKAAIRELGGNPDEVTVGVTGGLHRIWVDIKRTISNDEERTAIEACVQDERAALEEYEDILSNPELNEDLRELLTDQKHGIERALAQSEQLGKVFY